MINDIIVVFAVFILVNGFVVFIFNKVCINLKNQSKRALVKHLNVFDELIETKLSEINTLQRTIEDLKQSYAVETNILPIKSESTVSHSNVVINQIADYVDFNFYDNYKYLKDNFNIDYASVLKSFIKNNLNRDENILEHNIYKKMLSKFDFDERYNILIMPENEHLNILKQKFNEEENNTLNEYLKLNLNFNLLNFFEYLDQKARERNSTAIVKISKELNYLSNIDDRIDFIIDENILEGLSIIYKNKVYDFSFGGYNE